MTAGENAAKLAFEMYIHRLRREIGAMAASLGGVVGVAVALVATQGAGSNSPPATPPPTSAPAAVPVSVIATTTTTVAPPTTTTTTRPEPAAPAPTTAKPRGKGKRDG